MADGTLLNAGSGGNTAATDDIAGTHYQIIKLAHGALDSATLVTTSSGLPVQMQGTWNITNAGTFATQVDGAALTALQLIDNPVVVDDAAFTPATTSVSMAGFTFDDVAPDSVNEGDAGAARMSANRNIYVNIRDNAGNERGLNVDASGNITVNVTGTVTVGSHAVTNAGTFAVQVDGAALTALQVIDNPVVVDDAAFTPATTSVTMAGFEYDDTLPDSVDEGDAGAARMSANRNQYVQIRDGAGNERGAVVDANGYLTTNINGTVTVGSHAVTNAGTFAVQVDGAALTALQLIDNLVLAEDAAAAGGESGVQIFAVRKDTGGTLASADGDFTPLQTDSSGYLRVNVAAGGAGDGAILDGVSSAIKATVLDYANSNPLAVRLTDTSGDYVGAGAGTQYTEDAAAAADPVGTVPILVRKDTPATVTSADGDNIAQRGTNYGAAYVQLVTSAGAYIDSVGGGTQYAVDAALGATPTGTLAVAIRDDALSALTPVEGDAIGLRVDANGALWVIPSGTVTVSGTVTANPASGTITTVSTVSALGAGTTGPQKAEDVASANADVGIPAMAVQKATPANTAGTDGDYEFLQMSAGRLWTSATIDAALPAGTNAIGKLAANTGVDIGDVDVTSVVPGTGATNLGKAEDAAHSSSDTGVYVLAVRDTSPAAHSGADGDYESLHVNDEGGLWVTSTGSASGGLTTFRSIDLDETEEEVKATAGTVYAITAFNRTAAPGYLKLYNATAAGTTVGSTTPQCTFVVPANADSDGAGFVIDIDKGIAFSTAISAAVTTGVADADTGAPGANDFVVQIFYK